MDVVWAEYLGIDVTRFLDEIVELGSPGCDAFITLNCGVLKDDGARKEIRGRVQNSELCLPYSVMTWNSKKKETEDEVDYLVIMKRFHALEVAKNRLGELKGAVERMEGIKGVDVRYLRKIDVEGNGVVASS